MLSYEIIVWEKNYKQWRAVSLSTQSTATTTCPTETALEAFVTGKQNILNQLSDEKRLHKTEKCSLFLELLS